MTVVAVTGANGFIGSHVRQELVGRGVPVRALVRSQRTEHPHTPGQDFVHVEFDDEPAIARALEGADAVVHLVGHAPQRRPDEARYRRVNVGCTRSVLEAASHAGVSRFLFVSSVKAIGNGGRDPYTDHTLPRPADGYGRSKLEAEDAVRAIGAARGIDHIILRPPLVYGAGVKGNLRRLIAAVERRRPIPVVRSVRNSRSLISARNLASAIAVALTWTDPINDTYLVSDGVDVSTLELIELIARAADVEARTVPIPRWLPPLGAAISRQRAAIHAMFESLEIDSTRFATQFGWVPQQTLDQGLREAVDSDPGSFRLSS